MFRQIFKPASRPAWFGTIFIAWVFGFAASAPVLSDTLPPNALVLGLQDNEWKLFVTESGRKPLRVIPTHSEPRTPDLCVSRGTVIYIDAAGALREVHLDQGKEQVLLKTQQGGDAYTQPAYNADCQSVLVVRLSEGSSADTDIVQLDLGSRKVELLVRQRSSQFEPRPGTGRQIYYGSVHCTVGCGRIIEEIWRIDAATGVAGQVTLMNAVSQGPAPASDGDALFFSSNRDGNFHIWRQSLIDTNSKPLTNGIVTDVSPAVDGAGGVYFIRRTPTGTALMHVTKNGAEKVIPLKPQPEDLRDLRIDWREYRKGGQVR